MPTYANQDITATALVEIDYTNFRGERKKYRIQPQKLFCGSEYHPGVWVLEALDVDRHCQRGFALANIHTWTDLKEGS